MADGGGSDLKELTRRLDAVRRGPTDVAGTMSQGIAAVEGQRLHKVLAEDGRSNAFAVQAEGLVDIKDAIRAAMQLEFATIPLYLTALWSILDQAHPVARFVRAVVHEEMLHLSLLCNLLSALGERPVLTGEIVPAYPCRFPGGVHPELELRLEGYGPGALATFMEIERPEEAIPIDDDVVEPFPSQDLTIGRFYTALLAAIKRVNPRLDPSRQIAGPFTWFVMTSLDQVEQALLVIMAQGEGAQGAPFARFPEYLSHYYRFKSLAMQTELTWDPKAGKLRRGAPIPDPPVFTLAPAPEAGYGPAAPGALRRTSAKFEQTYSRMLRQLEGSWLEGGDKAFVRALELMFELGGLAQEMMHMATPDGRGYCPTFRYRP